jgi:ATP-binding cassette subfamily B protein
LLRDIWRKDKKLFVYLLTESSLGILLPVFTLFLPKIAVDLVTEQAGFTEAFAGLGAVTVLYALIRGLYQMVAEGKYSMYNGLRPFYMKKTYEKSLTCDYEKIESAKGQTQYQKAIGAFQNGDWSATSRLVTSMLALFSCFMSFLLYSSVLSYLNPLILLFLILFSALNYAAMRAVRNYEYQTRDERAETERKLNYVESKAGDIAAGKDIRLYSMARWLKALRDRYFAESIRLSKQLDSRLFLLSLFGSFLLLLRDGTTYAYLTWSVLSGRLSVGDFVLFFGAVTGFSGFINSFLSNFNIIQQANLQMNDFREFMEDSDEAEPESPQNPIENGLAAIELKDVCFSYQAGEKNVLEHFSLSIAPGEKIALVGVNGVGKTTLVKLICKFYQPNSGEVRLNGISLKNIPKKEVFRQISAVFQDITLLPVTIAENVSMQKREETDDACVWECLEKAGLKSIAEEYPKGIDTVLLRDVDPEGVVLSGGQQQKLLMARALYKKAPILILDEPTAALDPIAESEVYEQFRALSQNKTAIFISHRLASTRFCDRIVLISGGRAAEIGTHEQLLRAGGEYARMFEIQSHYYQDSSEREGGIYEA